MSWRRSAWRAALSVGLVLCAVPARDMTKTSIAIDGDFEDWAPILLDAQNAIPDAAASQGDPDAPSKAVRDMRSFAYTWDDTHLYLYFKRTKGANDVYGLAYIDLDSSGDLDSGDVVLSLKWQDERLKQGSFWQYLPAGGTDPITGDGVPEPGQQGAELPATIEGRGNKMDERGVRFEASISWADLGVAPGSPLNFHASLAEQLDLPAEVRDNAEPGSTGFHRLELDDHNLGSAEPGGCVLYPHTLANQGNLADTVNLRFTSTTGASVSLWTDPDGNGDPSDGVLLASDAQGNGLFLDPGDFLDPAADSDANDLPDFVQDPGVVSAMVLVICVPGSLNPGDEDVTEALARSAADPMIIELNEDTTAVGYVTLAPDRELRGVQGASVYFPHLVCNNTDIGDIADLTALSQSGWSVAIWSDPNGDGNPLDGTPISQTGLLSPHGCEAIVMVADIPQGEPTGSQDIISVEAQLQTGGHTDAAVDELTVARPVVLGPPNTGITAPGSSIFYRHILTNSLAVATNFALSAASSLGSTVSFWSDPDGDGRIDDGTLITNSGTVPPFGGRTSIVVQIDIPSSAQHGDRDTVTLRATAINAVDKWDEALDITDIRLFATFADPFFLRPASAFPRCVTVYAQAQGLKANKYYRFVWYDAIGNLRRISLDTRSTGGGEADDSLAITIVDPTGVWLVKVQEKQGSNYVDVEPGGSADFEVSDDLGAAGGVISSLSTNSINYALSGETLLARALLSNPSPVSYRDTFVDYTVFFDQNSDGAPSPGEDYIRLDGSAGLWVAGAFTCRSSGIPILFPEQSYLDESCQVSGVSFTRAGTWTLCATWFTNCGSVVDEGCSEFNVGCGPGDLPQADAGADREICLEHFTQLGGPGQPGHGYEWFPAEYLDDPSSPEPVAAPPETTVFTLTVTNSSTGCVNTDQVEVTVHPNPAADAGPSQSMCLGDPPVTLGTAPGAGLSCSWDPPDGLSSPSICRPQAAPAGDTSYLLTVTDDVTGCFSTDVTVVEVNPLPPADAGPDGHACTTKPWVQLGTSGLPNHSYSWQPPESLSDPAAPDPMAAPTVETLYTLTVIDDRTSCEASDEVLVTVGDPEVDAGPDVDLCEGDPGATIGTPAVPGQEYLWEPPEGLDDPTAAQPLALPAATTDYLLTTRFSDERDCYATAAVTVSVHPLPVADAGGPEAVLAPAEIGVPPCDPDLEYSWTPPDGLSNPNICNPVADPRGVTDYCLVARSPTTGCESEPDCITVLPAGSACPEGVPTPVQRLAAVKRGENVHMEWQEEDRSDGGYRLYRTVEKALIPQANAVGDLVNQTLPGSGSTSGDDLGAVPGPGGSQYFYQVVGLCPDGETEGAL